jgi:hypothetical protein
MNSNNIDVCSILYQRPITNYQLPLKGGMWTLIESGELQARSFEQPETFYGWFMWAQTGHSFCDTT